MSSSTSIAKESISPKYRYALRSPIIVVKVGPKLREYHLHKALLERHSGYFRGALGNPNFASAQDGVVQLEHVDPAVFEVFAWFLYRDCVPMNQRTWDQMFPDPLSGFKRSDWTTKAICCYVFADEILAIEFKNCVIYLAFRNLINDSPPYEAVTYAFDHLPGTSPMLTLLIESQTTNWENRDSKKGVSEEEIERLPALFLYRTSQAFRQKLKDTWTMFGVHEPVKEVEPSEMAKLAPAT